MTDNVVPLRFNVEEVGKHVKSSKKRFTWQVSLGSRQHSIVLDFSFISGKVKVAVDRKVLLQNQLPANTSFQYPFTLDGNSLNVIQQGESFQLRINNKVFSHLYNQMKTNKEFKKYEDQVKDFKVNENQFQAKKLTLNIGGVGNGMKKKTKQQAEQGHNWNAFGGDDVGNFPNYFEGQSVSTAASTQKVQQVSPQVAQKRVHDNLLDDSESSTQQQSKPQNILDFQSQIQSTPQQQFTNTHAQEDFNTMQVMFQSMGVNSMLHQQQSKSTVVDNSEVDFFNSVAVEEKPAAIDFFGESNTNTMPVSNVNVNFQQPSTQYSTMQHMFATNVPVGQQQSNLNQYAFSTGVNLNNPKQQSSGMQFNWNANNNLNNNINLNTTQPENTGFNLNTNTNTVEQPVDAGNFSTLQGLFATNAMMGGNSFSMTQQQPTVVKQQLVQTNFSLNPQHFATQQLPNQGFGTSYNVNPQAFGTQNFMGQNAGSQQINFLEQQNTTLKQQPVQQPIQQINLATDSNPTVNASDFSSMQFLFKTNVPTQQPQSQPQPQAMVQPQISMQKQPQSFTQQFATTSGVSTQSPNTMFMNTYGGGSGNPNLSFDLSLNNQPQPQQFATSVNPSMMKKKAPETATNVADLL